MRNFVIFMLALVVCGCINTEERNRYERLTLEPSYRDIFDRQEANREVIDEVIGEVYFEYDSDELKPSTQKQLNQFALLINETNGDVILEGHADHFNTETYNIRLAYERALAVADYLKSAGVWEERMAIHSFGENRPKASNWDENSRPLNRRVVIKIFAQNGGLRGKGADAIIKVLNQHAPTVELSSSQLNEVTSTIVSFGGGGGQ